MSIIFHLFLFLPLHSLDRFIPILDVPASGLYFLSYEYVKDYTGKNFGTEGSTGLIGTICAGGAAGLGYWAVGMPGNFWNFFRFFWTFLDFWRRNQKL